MVEGRELIEKIQGYLKKTGLADGLLIFADRNTDPYIRMISGGVTDTHTVLYVPKEGAVVGITKEWECGSLKYSGLLDEVHAYGDLKELNKLIVPLVTRGRSALNFSVNEERADFITHEHYGLLERLLGRAQDELLEMAPGHLAERFRNSQKEFRKNAFVSSEALWKEAGLYDGSGARPADGRVGAMSKRAKRLKAAEGAIVLLGGTGPAKDLLLNYISGVRHAKRSAFVKGALIVHESEASLVPNNGVFDEVLVYGGSEKFRELLSEKTENLERLSCDLKWITEGSYRLLLEASGKKEIESAEDNITEIKTSKVQEEIEGVRLACRVTDRIVKEAFGEIRSGMTEKQIYGILVEKAMNWGAEGMGQPIVAIGKNSSNILHRALTEETAENGKNILIDIGVDFDGMANDVCYNGFFGDPPEEYLKAHKAVEKALNSAIENVRAGVPGKDVDGAARGALAEDGYPDFDHVTGHPCGFEPHDVGVGLSKGEERELPEGEIVAIEPAIYRKGKWGIRIEANVLVKRDGAEVLGNIPKLLTKKL